MIRASLMIVAVGITVSVAAQLSSPLPQIAAKVGKRDPSPTHNATFANGVRGIPDIVYDMQTGYRPLTLDLYLAPDSIKRRAAGFPLVIYVHGGAWLAGNSRRPVPFADFPGVLAPLSAEGYVVASVNYRLSSEARFPAQIQDVKAAIRWLKANAAEYGVDPTCVLTWGVLAGGYLAVLAAVSCHAASLEPHQPIESVTRDAVRATVDATPVSDCVQGVVSWYGVFDMSTIAAQATQDGAMSRDDRNDPEWRLLGCFGTRECTPARIAAASPVTYVKRDDPPMLLIVGSADKLVPYPQTLEMADRLKAAGVTHRLIVLPGVDHSLLGKTPEQTRDANMQALAATFRFIDQTIGHAPKAKR